MDFFVGARMHATIAAISSGVATVPFSYSRKFEGLYYNLQYKYIVSARNINTEEALDHTFEWLSRISELKEAGKKASSIAVSKLDLFEKDVINALKNY